MARAATTLRCPYCSERLEFMVSLTADLHHGPGRTTLTVKADEEQIARVMEAHLSSRFERFGSFEDHMPLLVSTDG